MKFDIAPLVSEKTSIVDIYICPKQVKDDDMIEVGWDIGKAPPVQNMGPGSPSSIRVYIHRDIMYSYDLSNDAQKVTRQIFEKDAKLNSLYAISYEEEVLPCHRFPCTDEIVHESLLLRTTYRINNRVMLIYDKDEKEYVYIRYQHASNVDIGKMNQDINNCLRKITWRR